MPEYIKNATEVIQFLRNYSRKIGSGREEVAVSYYAKDPKTGEEYALKVHEDLQMRHPRGGQAKYLEQPARENEGKYRQIVVDSLNKGNSMLWALTQAAKALLADSQDLVPVDTSRLHDSGTVLILNK